MDIILESKSHRKQVSEVNWLSLSFKQSPSELKGGSRWLRTQGKGSEATTEIPPSCSLFSAAAQFIFLLLELRVQLHI